MTVGELKEALKGVDDSALVCTNGTGLYEGGIMPAESVEAKLQAQRIDNRRWINDINNAHCDSEFRVIKVLAIE